MYNKIRREEADHFSRPSRTNSPVVSVASEYPLHEFIAVVIIQSQQLTNWEYIWFEF
jgi:hypothetical protein